MDPIGGSSAAYGVFSAAGGGQVEAFHLGEEIHSLVTDTSPPENGSSFTALLGLQGTEAIELLHHPDSAHSPVESRPRGLSFGCLPTFPPSAAPAERPTRLSSLIPAAAGVGRRALAEGSPENSSDPSVSGEMLNQLAKVKSEAVDSDPALVSPPQDSRSPANNNKRKETAEKQKVRSGGKKSRGVADSAEQAEKLPYVHVRARRGQATDSHSLAERARREKINVRMKLLQELVPGCNKISGTALVLDEIINHVQSLQRQVEFLSMRLASVNPRVDFGLDGFFSGESGTLTPSSGGSPMAFEGGTVWPEMQQAGVGPRRLPHHQQLWHLGGCATDAGAPSACWGRDDARPCVNPDATTPTSILGYDSLNSDFLPVPHPTFSQARIKGQHSLVGGGSSLTADSYTGTELVPVLRA